MASPGRIWTIHGTEPPPAEAGSVPHQLAALQQAITATRAHLKREQDRSAATLLESELRYRRLFDNVPAGIYRLRADGTVELANPAFVRLLGFRSLAEMSHVRLNPPEELLTPGNSGHVKGCERKLVRADGSQIFVRESGHLVPDLRGGMDAYEGVVEDITPTRTARRFEQGCRDLLERVARNEPLRDLLARLVDLVKAQAPGSGCAILLNSDGRLKVAAGEKFPPAECSHSIGDLLSAHTPTRKRTAAGALEASSHPVLAGSGQVLGSIVLWGGRKPGAYMLQTASGIAAIAIEHSRLCRDLEQQASHDALTGIPNRSLLERQLSTLIETCDTLALCWLDLDDFQRINESLGHAFGDELLREVASRIAQHAPADAYLARMPADEFALLIPDIYVAGARSAAAHLLAAFEAPFQINGFELFVTASVGVAIYPDHGLSSAELLQNGDAAMHHAKSAGRNGCSVYQDGISDSVRDRMDLVNGLHRVLERQELRLEYQPQVDASGKVRGMEALLRWQHPVRGLLSPVHFIGAAEQAGLIVPIGNWVIAEACRQAAVWNQNQTEPLRVAVNVSPLQFFFSDLTQVVRNALDATGLPAECLELELTESTFVRDRATCATDLRQLRSLGITIAIDDFGTGYSCLSYLRQLPVDVLKIDRSFLTDLQSPTGGSVLASIAALAHSLGLRVVAEGVENEQQLAIIRKLGIDLAQGFLLGRPQAAESVLKWLVSGGTANPALARPDEPDQMAGSR